MGNLALTAITTDQGIHQIVIAEQGIKGYKVFSEGHTTYRTAQVEADRGNKALGLDEYEAMRIIFSSMR